MWTARAGIAVSYAERHRSYIGEVMRYGQTGFIHLPVDKYLDLAFDGRRFSVGRPR